MPDYTDSRLVSLLAGEGRVACSVSLARGTEEGMDPDDLLCSRNARPQKVWRKGMRRFLCSRSARPEKGLARRPQSKAPHAFARLSSEMNIRIRMDARSGRPIQATLMERIRASLDGRLVIPVIIRGGEYGQAVLLLAERAR